MTAIPAPPSSRGLSILATAEHLRTILDAGGWFPSLSNVLAVIRTDSATVGAADLANALNRLRIPHEIVPVTPDDVLAGTAPTLLVDGAGGLYLVVRADPDLGLQVVDRPSADARWIGVPDGPLSLIDIAHASSTPDKANEAESMVATLRAIAPQLWPMALISCVINVLGLATPLFVMTVYDTAMPSRSVDAIAMLGLGLGLAYAVEFALRNIRREAIVHLVADFEDRMGLSLVRKTLALPLAALSRSDAYRQQTRLRRFEGIRDALSGPLTQAVFDLPFLAVFGAALFIIAPGVGWIVLACAIVSLLALAVLSPFLRARDSELSDLQDTYRRQAEEAVERQSEIRRHGLSEKTQARLEKSLQATLDAGMRAQALRQSAGLAVQALLIVSGLSASYYATRLAVQGELQMGALIAVMILIWRFLMPVQVLTTASQQAVSVLESIRVIEALFAMPEERYRGVTAAPPCEVGPPLQFDQVTLRFPDTTMPAVLGVSFEVPAGQIVAVAGRTMSGKTCLAELAAGLHWPSAGRILMAGRMIRQLPLDDVRSGLAYCPQTPQVFPGTIRQNLRFAAPLADEPDFWRALEEAGAATEVRALPQGLDTEADSIGAPRLGDGLRQRLSLAMTFLRPGPIHIFDQPTDGLCAAAGTRIREAIRDRAKFGAVLLISNDPEDLALADRTLVLDRGRIVSNDRGRRGRDRAIALLT
ncbi:MAG: ATP-binding cassette domain-containing protein [Pseudomonadota bacterium]